jgi:hypothetical protein
VPSLDKEVIRQAGTRVQLYKGANEPDLAWSYSPRQAAGVKEGNHWIRDVRELKKYARALGFAFYVGGPAHDSRKQEPRTARHRPRRMLANRKHLAGYGVDGDGLCLELHHVDRRAVLRLQLDRDHIAETEALRGLLRQLYRLLG